MAIGESNPETPPTSHSKPKDVQVDVSQYQKLDNRQLSALLSQHKVSLPSDTSADDKIRALLDFHMSQGHKLVGVGTLQILPDGFGFLRSRWFNYLSGPDDIYVSPSQIRKFDLTNGAEVEGNIRPPKENERYFALLRVSKVNGLDPNEATKVPVFDNLQTLAPNTRISFDGPNSGTYSRVTDLVSPIGFGQRGVVASPARSGKTRLIEDLCKTLQSNHSEIYTFVLLVDQRPEEIDQLQDTLDGDNCEVIGLEFGESASRNHDVAMMVLEKAKRKVETGHNVFIFLDSLTNLARIELGPTYNKNHLEPGSLKNTISFLRSAKRAGDVGSLTILATLKTDSDNPLDDAIADSLIGAANLEIRLDRELVRRRVWPAINIHDSQTQQEEALLGDQYDAVCKLRRTLGDLSATEAMEVLLKKIESSISTQDLLSRE